MTTNKIDILISQKSGAISKSEAKAEDLQTTVRRKARIINDYEAKIARLREDMALKQSQLDSQHDFIREQQETLERIRHELKVWHSVDERLETALRTFEKLSNVVGLNPKAKEDGTMIDGHTYSTVRTEIDMLRRIKTDAEDHAAAIYYGKR